GWRATIPGSRIVVVALFADVGQSITASRQLTVVMAAVVVVRVSIVTRLSAHSLCDSVATARLADTKTTNARVADRAEVSIATGAVYCYMSAAVARVAAILRTWVVVVTVSEAT